jgi:hypothetical protein
LRAFLSHSLLRHPLRVRGYATAAQIRDRDCYEASSRTYYLAVEDLHPDLNAMCVIQDLYPSQRSNVPDLPILSSGEIEPLLEKLSQTTAYSPWLGVSFSEWAAILASDELRHTLHRRRTQPRFSEQEVSIVVSSNPENSNLQQA